jgi:hypothetical protein
MEQPIGGLCTAVHGTIVGRLRARFPSASSKPRIYGNFFSNPCQWSYSLESILRVQPGAMLVTYITTDWKSGKIAIDLLAWNLQNLPRMGEEK